jgi:hypothetical protein
MSMTTITITTTITIATNIFSWWHKIALLKLATEINYKKFEILANGLAILELKKLEDRVTALRNGIISESEFKVSN